MLETRVNGIHRALVSHVLRRALVLSSATFALLVCGCERSIEGQIFIATQGAGAYLMPLVPVHALQQGDMVRLRDEWSTRVDALISDAQREVLSAQLKHGEARQNLDGFVMTKMKTARQALADYTGFPDDGSNRDYLDPSTLRMPNLDRAAVEQEPLEPLKHRVDFVSLENASEEIVTLVVKALSDSNYPQDDPYPYVPPPVFYEYVPESIYRKLQSHFIANRDSRAPKELKTELLAIAADYIQEWRRLRGVVRKLAFTYSELLQAASQHEEAYLAANQTLEDAKRRKDQPSEEEIAGWLQGFLASVKTQTKTAADGNFTIKTALPIKYLIASGERVVGSGNTEKYFWAVDIDDPKNRLNGRLALSSDNRTTYKELLRLP
jgi:hypothetical protein